VPLNRLGETDHLASKTLDPRAQRQMLAFDLLYLAFAWLMLIRIEMTRISAPVVRVIASDAKWLEQPFELEEDLILLMSKNIGQRRG